MAQWPESIELLRWSTASALVIGTFVYSYYRASNRLIESIVQPGMEYSATKFVLLSQDAAAKGVRPSQVFRKQ